VSTDQVLSILEGACDADCGEEFKTRNVEEFQLWKTADSMAEGTICHFGALGKNMARSLLLLYQIECQKSKLQKRSD
jgi:hypothetical protein